ncbi:hypothetical protein Syun_007635 [Stephania yunnanensis]|uniref:Uncharacterized protein n=1 Tax=Stephania yunnanensis TaxID=152371 RepID=A0AAP0L2K5_9MAGN
MGVDVSLAVVVSCIVNISNSSRWGTVRSTHGCGTGGAGDRGPVIVAPGALLLVPANPFHLKHQDLRRCTVAEDPPPPSSPSSSTAIVVVDRDSSAQSFIRDLESPRTPARSNARRRCRCAQYFSSVALFVRFFLRRRCSSPPLPLFSNRRRCPLCHRNPPTQLPPYRRSWLPPRSSVAAAQTPLRRRPPRGRLRRRCSAQLLYNRLARLLHRRWFPSTPPRLKVDVDHFVSSVVDLTSEIVSDNDEFETNADDEEDDEFTSSSDIGREDEFEGHGNPEDEDVEDINRHPEETSTTGRGSLSHHATPAHPDGRYSLHYTHGWSHVTRPYPTYAPGPSSSHYTSSSPPDHPYPYQHGTPSPPAHALPPQHGFIPSSSHHSTLSPPADVYPHDHGIRPSSSHHATPSPSGHPAHSPGVGDEHTSTSRRPPAPHRHSSTRSSSSRLRSSIPQAIEEILDFFRPPTAPAEGENPLIYLIAEHGFHPMKHSRKSLSSNRKFEVGGPGTGISLHSAGSISARQHGDTLEKKLQRRPTRKAMFRHLHTHGHDGQSFVDQRSAKIDAELTRRLEEMSTQTPDTSIDEDAVYLEVVPEVKGRVYGLGSQGYHRSISSGGASSSQGPAYVLHELEELQRDHQRLQETLLKERMERQEQMQRDKMERQEETREMLDRLARMEALLLQHLGIRPHVPPTPRTPPSPVTECSGPRSDDHPGNLTTEIAPSQSAHPHDHRPGHWTSPLRRMSEDQRHLLDDHDEFMEQLMPPPRPPPRQE